MIQKIIAKGKVIRRSNYPYYYLALEEIPAVWGLGIWVGPYLGKIITISVEKNDDKEK